MCFYVSRVIYNSCHPRPSSRGVLSGQSLIKSAELRGVTADLDRYQTSIHVFRDKYFALPGDMSNATRFWGVRAGTGSDTTCTDAPSTDKLTCNGDGDGRIYGEDSSYGGGQRFESYRAWQHLANAELIEGRYTGVTGPSDPVRHTVAGTNSPKSRMSNGGFDFWWLGLITLPETNLFEGDYGTTLSFGGTKSNDISNAALLTPSEAWNIDTKLDDGKPAFGKIRVYMAGAFGGYNCATTAVSSTAAYALTTTTAQCAILFLTGF